MKYEIEIPDLPEGWEPVSCYKPRKDIDYILTENGIALCNFESHEYWLIVRKKQPRRIVLEETNKAADPEWIYSIRSNDITINIQSEKIWKIVDEKESNQNV
jgi:hypothetical protein